MQLVLNTRGSFAFICGSNSLIYLSGDYKLILTGYSQVSPKFRAGRLYHDQATPNIHAPAAPSDDGHDCKKCM
ncbi:MAG: hypothetical protein GQ533_14915 [Methanosarcinaceae archaeon]|nr:hypothetical protein [Methanosarcinaceae archaeon]